MIAEQFLEVRRLCLSPHDLNEIRVAIAPGELDETKPVAVGIEAERFCINRHYGRKRGSVREVALV